MNEENRNRDEGGDEEKSNPYVIFCVYVPVAQRKHIINYRVLEMYFSIARFKSAHESIF